MVKYFVYNFEHSARVYSDTNDGDELLEAAKLITPENGPHLNTWWTRRFKIPWPYVRKGPWGFYYLYVWGKPLETLRQSNYKQVWRKELEADKKEIEFKAYNQRMFQR